MNHLIEQVRQQQPLIHNITNQVVMNFTANGLYAVGAAPVMAHAKEEVEEMARQAGALVLNIGTLSKIQIEAMILAGKAANQAGVPVVLDPVGVGATPFRTASAKQILQEVEIACIRGNAGEIANLAGIEAKVKGVEGVASIEDDDFARQAFASLQVPLVITGAEDILIDNEQTIVITNGDPLLTKITGTGCLLSAVVAAFIAVHDQVLEAAAAAVSYYGVAAEQAAAGNKYPGSFQVAFLNELYRLEAEEISLHQRMTRSSK
ncbi:hydroxyethylthiazole kinase [Gracilibacillus alcaliphilus]|uniref:hydroxyethylthiazole kinase n=1 Tax=Gracilibacillus alcaliphilus TaxID=1401441 RepID=UPI00195E5B94|nr:hydroxyethylthiazole kinase [Gracilibacillus alcaliphilus]MBM7677837.1 hydroxyethylthiazole kinase [Gracilibacillus alcaliphilus]